MTEADGNVIRTCEARRIASMMEGLPSLLFVRNAGSFRGRPLGNTVDD